jgi:hypothetical protein
VHNPTWQLPKIDIFCCFFKNYCSQWSESYKKSYTIDSTLSSLSSCVLLFRLKSDFYITLPGLFCSCQIHPMNSIYILPTSKKIYMHMFQRNVSCRLFNLPFGKDSPVDIDMDYSCSSFPQTCLSKTCFSDNFI